MTNFHHVDPSLPSLYRAVILFGLNSASYKFSLGKSLIELTNGDAEFVPIETLARHFSKHVADHISDAPKQSTRKTPVGYFETCRRFNLGEIDVIIGQAGLLKIWPDLRIEKLARFNVAAMVRKDHPLLSKSKISEVDILKYPMALPATVETLETDVARLYAQNGLPPLNAQFSCDDFELTCNYVQNTNAFALVISLSSTFGNLDGNFHLFKNKLNLPPQEIAIAHSRSRTMTPAAKKFHDLAKKLLRNRKKNSK